MRKLMVAMLALALAIGVVPATGFAQAAKTSATNSIVVISNDDIQAVVKKAAEMKRTIPDNMLRVLDMGKYQVGVAIVSRGKSTPAGGGGAGNGSANEEATAGACGNKGPKVNGPTGIYHLDTTEIYVVTSGGGTMVLGGTISNGGLSSKTGEVTTTLNGSSCMGTVVGYTTREVKQGDVVVIPTGAPHGFASVPDHISYLCIRPDPKKVLAHGYVNPMLPK